MKTRVLLPEWMDDPELNQADHFQALRGLQRINQWTRLAALAWGPIRDLARQLDRTRLRILDIATGGADVPIQLWRQAQAVGLELDVDACDFNPQALQFAAANCRRVGACLQLQELDILNQSIEEEYDVVMCSQFMHHLTDAQAEQVLGEMARSAGWRVIVVDLVRSRLNWLQVWLATRTLSRSPIVHFDGPQSIRASFRIDEIRSIARSVGFTRFSVEPHWPCRFLLVGDVK